MDYEISRIKHVADYSRNTDIYYEVRVKKKRKKCIKMDDKSQSGRNTVKEYLSDDLGSILENEKMILKVCGK